MAASNRLFLSLILASATLTIMAGSVIAPALNLMREGLGIAPANVGLIITTHGLFMAVFSPLMGAIIDRNGVRRTYIAALFLYGLAGGAGLLIHSFWVLLISRACLGIGLAGIFAGINVLILNTYEKAERDKVMGWRGSAQSCGGIVWPLLGGALGAVSWRLPFAVYLVAIPIGLLAIAALPEPAVNIKKNSSSGGGQSVFQIFRNQPVLFIIYGLTFFGSLLLYSIVVFLPQLLERFGITSSFHIGLFIVAMTASGAVTAFVYGRIRKRFSYERIATMVALLWILAFITISLASRSYILAIGAALFGISQGLLMPTVMVWIGIFVPPAFRGRFSSYLGTFGFIGQFLSPVLFAPVFIHLGFRGVFFTGAGVGVVWLLLLSTFAFRAAGKQTSA
jgi:MFS family permease